MPLSVVQSPLDRAQAAKNKGNKYFKATKYENAIQCYTEAISLCPKEQKADLSTFYQNRAAAYEQQVGIMGDALLKRLPTLTEKCGSAERCALIRSDPNIKNKRGGRSVCGSLEKS